MIITTVIVLVASLISPLSVSAYVAADSLYVSYYRTRNFTAPSNGIYLFHTLYRCNISPSAPGLKLIDMLDKSYLAPYSGNLTFQGVKREEDKIMMSDIDDVVGFSQTYSYSSLDSYFVYSVITCVPVVEGDTFYYYSVYNTDFVSNASQFCYSFIPYGTGFSKVYEGFHTSSSESNELTYTTKSENQHLACLLSPASFASFAWNCSPTSTASSNLSFVKSARNADVYTTTYGLPKNSTLSVSSEAVDFSYSVYEIFTDGTISPGAGDSESGGSGSGGTGDVTVNVDMTETNSKLDSLIAAVQALPAEIWDCFKVGLGISSDSSSGGSSSGGASSILPPSDGDMKVEIDPEELGSTLDTVEKDSASMFERTRGAFNFFWTFTDKFFTATDLYGIIGISLIFALLIWLLNR